MSLSDSDEDLRLESRPDPLFDPQSDKTDLQWLQKKARRAKGETPSDAHDNKNKDKNTNGGKDLQPQKQAAAPAGEAEDAAFDRETLGQMIPLCCPSCFIALCRDYQPHARHRGQFRAMFVSKAAIVLQGQILRFNAEEKGLKGMGAGDDDGDEDLGPSLVPGLDENTYHPVVCSCGLEVGVYDHHEIFHFFNVLQ